MSSFLAPGWTCTAPIFWLPVAAVLPVSSNDRDNPRNVPENMVATAPDDFVMRDPTRAARFLISSAGDRLTVVGVTWPETVRRGVIGLPLARVLDPAQFPIAPEVSILRRLRPNRTIGRWPLAWCCGWTRRSGRGCPTGSGRRWTRRGPQVCSAIRRASRPPVTRPGT